MYVCAYTFIARGECGVRMPKESAFLPAVRYTYVHISWLSGECIFAHNVHVGRLGNRAKIESRLAAAILSRQECTKRDYRDTIAAIAAITSNERAMFQIRIRLPSIRENTHIRISGRRSAILYLHAMIKSILRTIAFSKATIISVRPRIVLSLEAIVLYPRLEIFAIRFSVCCTLFIVR